MALASSSSTLVCEAARQLPGLRAMIRPRRYMELSYITMTSLPVCYFDVCAKLLLLQSLPLMTGTSFEVGSVQEPNGHVQRLAGEMVFRWYSSERKTSIEVNCDEY